jgi:hypothetical protein
MMLGAKVFCNFSAGNSARALYHTFAPAETKSVANRSLSCERCFCRFGGFGACLGGGVCFCGFGDCGFW